VSLLKRDSQGMKGDASPWPPARQGFKGDTSPFVTARQGTQGDTSPLPEAREDSKRDMSPAKSDTSPLLEARQGLKGDTSPFKRDTALPAPARPCARGDGEDMRNAERDVPRWGATSGRDGVWAEKARAGAARHLTSALLFRVENPIAPGGRDPPCPAAGDGLTSGENPRRATIL
jgi:hypothetical protein